MYKLYTKRLVGKDAFKAMTGIEVKAMPKPHRNVRKPNMIAVSKDWKGTPPKGYKMRGSYDKNTKAMADAVTTLLKLPADVQAAIDIDALSQSYYDFLTAGKKGKTAAQAKAVEMLFTSVEAAIASGKLDAASVQQLQGLLAEIDSKKSVGDNVSEFEVSAAKYAGGRIRIDTRKFTTEEYSEYEEIGDQMYDNIRDTRDDVDKIAKNTGWDRVKIQAIKSHLFFEKHLFDDGEIRLFDSDYWQAEAWIRMTVGNMTELDEVLLKHEFFELEYIREHKCTYEEAHKRQQSYMTGMDKCSLGRS